MKSVSRMLPKQGNFLLLPVLVIGIIFLSTTGFAAETAHHADSAVRLDAETKSNA